MEFIFIPFFFCSRMVHPYSTQVLVLDATILGENRGIMKDNDSKQNRFQVRRLGEKIFDCVCALLETGDAN